MFKACTGLIGNDDDIARQALNSCNRLIEQYSGDLSRDKLGHVYSSRGIAKGHFKQYTSALSDYRRAIELGYPHGYYGLGGAYLNGTGVPKDKRRGVELFKKGCDLGDEYSRFLLKYFIPESMKR